MADINKKVKIDVEANTQDAEEKLGGLTGRMEQLSQQSEKSTASLGDIWKSFKTGIGSAKSLTDVLKVVGTSLKALIANPVGAVVAAVAIAVKMLTDAFKRNDEAGTALQRVMTALQIPMKLLQRLVDTLVVYIGKLLDKFMDFAAKVGNKVQPVLEKVSGVVDGIVGKMKEFAGKLDGVAQKLTEKGGWLGKLAGKIVGVASDVVEGTAKGIETGKNAVESAVESMNELGAASDRLVVMRDRLEQEERDYIKRSAKREREMAELRETLSDPEEDFQTRKSALEKWSTLQQAAAADEIQMIQKRIALKKLENTVNNDTSDEAADAITQLEAQLEGAYTRQAEAQRQYNKELKKLLREEAAARAAAAKLQMDLEKRLQEETTVHLKNVAAAQEGLLGALSVLSVDYVEEQRKLTEKMDEVRRQMLANEQELTGEITDERKQQLEQQNATLSGLAEVYSQQLADSTAKFQKNTENLLEKSGTDLEKFKADTTLSLEEQNEMLSDVYGEEQRQLQEALDNNLITREQYNEQMLALSAAYLAKKEELEAADTERTQSELEKQRQMEMENLKKRAATANDMLSSLGSVMNSIATAYGNEADRIMSKGDDMTDAERQQAIEALENQKKAMWVTFAIQQAQAIGSAVLAAATAAPSGGPAAPAVYAAVLASLLAGILASFISAKKSVAGVDAKIAELKAPKKEKKLASGGYVEGAGSGTSDSIPARLSNGESVINAKSTAMFYDVLSKINQLGGGRAFPNAVEMPNSLRFAQGGVAYNAVAVGGAVKDAVKDIQPVVSVKEITKMQSRVKMKENA